MLDGDGIVHVVGGLANLALKLSPRILGSELLLLQGHEITAHAFEGLLNRLVAPRQRHGLCRRFHGRWCHFCISRAP